MPSSLLPPTPTAGGASCPATPLPAGLGPAAAGSTGGGSAHLLPMAGLQQQRPYSSGGLASNGSAMPMPVQVGSQSAPVSPADAAGRLPDLFYTANPAPGSGFGGGSATAGRPSTAGLAPSGSGRLGGGGGGGGLNVGARPFTFGGGGGSGFGPGSTLASSGSRPDPLGSPVLGAGSQLRSASPSPLGPSFGGSSGCISMASTAPAFSPGAAAFSPATRSGSAGLPSGERPGSSAPPSARTFNSLSGGSSLTSAALAGFGSALQLPPVAGLLPGLPAQPQPQLRPPQLPGLARAGSPALSSGMAQASDQASEASSGAAGPVQLPGIEADSDGAPLVVVIAVLGMVGFGGSNARTAGEEACNCRTRWAMYPPMPPFMLPCQQVFPPSHCSVRTHLCR